MIKSSGCVITAFVVFYLADNQSLSLSLLPFFPPFCFEENITEYNYSVPFYVLFFLSEKQTLHKRGADEHSCILLAEVSQLCVNSVWFT